MATTWPLEAQAVRSPVTQDFMVLCILVKISYQQNESQLPDQGAQFRKIYGGKRISSRMSLHLVNSATPDTSVVRLKPANGTIIAIQYVGNS